MNTTEYFKRTIQAYLEERAMEDELFAAKYDNPDKNIDDCVTYILNWVQKSGCNGFCDDEIYGQAIHYYEEKDIEVGKPLNCQVSVNHHIELTEEEKAQYRAECWFLEAYYHFKVLQNYGPCPIIETKVDQNILPSEIPGRSHFDYCVDWIVGKLDAAAEVLPATQTCRCHYLQKLESSCAALCCFSSLERFICLSELAEHQL